MMKKLLAFIIMISISNALWAQLNDYKYLVVPVKFEVFENQNQHKTSTMTKLALVKQGFTVVYDDSLPSDLLQDPCLGLNVDLVDDSTMFATKVTLIMSDCDGVEVYRTKEGKSKEKNYEVSFREAIFDATSAMNTLNYKYEESNEKNTANEPVETVIINMGNDVIKMENDTISSDTPSRIQKRGKGAKNSEFVIEEKSTPEEQIYKSKVIRETDFEKASNDKKQVEANEAIETLYAQQVDEGYQLVDTTPKVVFKLIPTSLENIFLVKGIDDGFGLLHKNDEKWILEYNSKNGKTVRELFIKF